MPRTYQQLVSLDMQVQYAYQKIKLNEGLESTDSPEFAERYREAALIMAQEQPALIIPHVEVCISAQCTLHCRDCANFMQFYHNPKPMDLEQVWSWIAAFLESVDQVMTLSLIGGEPLMQKQFPQLLERVLQQPKVQQVQIVSNATLMPRDDLLQIMSNNKRCFIRFSNYGPKLAPRYQEIIQVCQEHNVLAVPQEPNIMWFDMGDCSDRHLKKKQKAEVYQRCPNECRHIWNGEFHNCPRSAQAKYLGFIKNIPEHDYVPLLKLDPATRRKRIRKMYDVNYIEACNHCGFASGFKYIPCAIQADRPSHTRKVVPTATVTATTATTTITEAIAGSLEPKIAQNDLLPNDLQERHEEQEGQELSSIEANVNDTSPVTSALDLAMAQQDLLQEEEKQKIDPTETAITTTAAAPHNEFAQNTVAYKILWYSIPALHDNSNGAAIHSKIMLEALVRRGIEVKVLNALVGDDIHGLEIFNHIAQAVGDTKERKFLQFNDTGIEYFIAKTKGHLSSDITADDQNTIFDLFVQLLDKYQPDMVMGYSGDMFSVSMRREAKMRGMTIAYALHNSLHRGFSFIDCDLVFTPSEATARMYHEEDGTNIKAVGQFIDKQRILATRRSQTENVRFVTLVNPTPEKGLAIFVKLHEVFARKHPEIPFLVVKSVGDYPSMVRSLHYKDGSSYVQTDVPCSAEQIKVAEHTADPRLIYDISRVVVMPSVCQEAWGCVATEAVMNGIPVLASKNGGLPEAVREGGILLDTPACTQSDYRCIPDDDEIAPWVEALERCLSEDWTEACRQASDYNDLEDSIDRLMVYLEPLLKQGQKNKQPLEHSSVFSDLTMQKRKQAYADLAATAAAAKQTVQDLQAQVFETNTSHELNQNQSILMQGNSSMDSAINAQNMYLNSAAEPLIDIEGYGKPKGITAPVQVASAQFAKVTVRNTLKSNFKSAQKNKAKGKRK